MDVGFMKFSVARFCRKQGLHGEYWDLLSLEVVLCGLNTVSLIIQSVVLLFFIDEVLPCSVHAIIIVKTVVFKTLKNWTVKITDAFLRFALFGSMTSHPFHRLAYTTLIEQKDNHNVFFSQWCFTLSCPTPVYILCIYSANCLQLAICVCTVHAWKYVLMNVICLFLFIFIYI